MLERVKSRMKGYIKTKPAAFDTLRGIQRMVFRKPDPAYDFLHAFSRAHGGQVTFVEVGASDGLRNDPFREFIVRDGWRGILVEPLPDVFELLKRNYAHCGRLTFVNAAITSRDGEMSFYRVCDDLLNTLTLEQRLDYQRKASFDRQHLERYVAPAHHWGITATPVPCLSMASLLAQHWSGEPIHLLAIDVEGHEPALIRSIDFTSWRPEVVFYEAHNFAGGRDEIRAIEQLLREAGYAIHNILGDTAAVRDDVRIPGY